MSINLPYSHAWITVVMSGLVLLTATGNFLVSYKNEYIGLLVLHLLPVLNPCTKLFYRYQFGRCLKKSQESPLFKTFTS